MKRVVHDPFAGQRFLDRQGAVMRGRQAVALLAAPHRPGAVTTAALTLSSAIMGPSDLVRALADLRHFANASGFNWRDTLAQAERLVLNETPRHGAHR